MKLAWIMFILLLGMCVALAAAFIIGEIPNGHGFNHSRIPNMQQGGSGIERHGNIIWIGLAFGLLQVAFFVACIALGAQRKGELGAVKRPLLTGALVYGAVFTGLVLTYRAYATEGEHMLFVIFPPPTAFMIYGLWTVPFFFLLLYMRNFNRWIYRPEDHEKFQKLIESRQQQGEEAD